MSAPTRQADSDGVAGWALIVGIVVFLRSGRQRCERRAGRAAGWGGGGM